MECLVGGFLGPNRFSPAVRSIRGEKELGARVSQPYGQRLRTEPCEYRHHDGPDFPCCQQRRHDFRHHRHVNTDRVARADTKLMHGGRDPTYLRMQLPIGHRPGVSVIALPQDRNLIRPGGEMPIQAVVHQVDLS